MTSWNACSEPGEVDDVMGKVKNVYLPGQIFGWLTVLGESRDVKGNRLINVRCRCGREYDTVPGTLKRKDVKCYCCANKIRAQLRTLPLVGKTFGIWNVLAQGEDDTKRGHQYYCRCSKCGKVQLKTQYEITHNNKSKCSECRPDYHFTIDGTHAVGVLPSGDRFIVDAEDIPLVNKYWWYKKSDADYILRNEKKNGKITHPRLHRYLIGLTDDDVVVDHINRNPLDCRKSNMRIATQTQNCLNKSMRSNNHSGYIGVSFSESYGLYEAKIMLAGNTILIGRSENPVECAQEYNCAALFLFRSFAGQLNDVPEASGEIKENVSEICRPFMELSATITKPVEICACVA